MNKLAAFNNMPQKQSMSAFANVPRRTEIMGQPHMLSYINPEEKAVLQQMRGGMPPVAGPGGVPSYLTWQDVKDSWNKTVSAVKDTFSGGGGGGGGRDFDADMSVGAINTGLTYSGSDPVVSGGFDFGNDNDDKPAVATGSSGYPSLDATAGGSTLVDVSGISLDDLNIDWDAYNKSLGIDTSYAVGSGSGSLVTGGASDSNEDFFDSVNTGSNFDDNTGGNTGQVDTSAKDDDLSVGSSTNTNTGVVNTSSKDDDLSVGSSTSTAETNYGGGGNTGNNTGAVDTSPKYYDMFGGVHETAYDAYLADEAYYNQSDTTQNNTTQNDTTDTFDTSPYFDLTDPNEPLVTGNGTPFTGNFDGVQYVNGQPVTSGTTTIYDGGQDTFESTFRANHGVPVPTTESEFMALSDSAKQDLALGLTNDELQELVQTISTNSGENATISQQLINFGADLLGVQGVGDDLRYKVDLSGMDIDSLLPNLKPLEITVTTTQELEDLYQQYYDQFNEISETVPFDKPGEVPLTVDELNEVVNAALGEGSEVPLTVEELNSVVNEALASAGDGGGQDDDVGGSGTDFGGLANQDYTDYTESGFQANDLTEGGNTIGYATSGENAGSSAIITPEGNVEILGPGSTETGIVFEGETAVDDAIDYLTGDSDTVDVPSGEGETITDTSTLQGILEASGVL